MCFYKRWIGNVAQKGLVTEDQLKTTRPNLQLGVIPSPLHITFHIDPGASTTEIREKIEGWLEGRDPAHGISREKFAGKDVRDSSARTGTALREPAHAEGASERSLLRSVQAWLFYVCPKRIRRRLVF